MVAVTFLYIFLEKAMSDSQMKGTLHLSLYQNHAVDGSNKTLMYLSSLVSFLVMMVVFQIGFLCVYMYVVVVTFFVSLF